ncbi:MAG: hypothetical protein ACK5VH_03570, partial [bacterium]
MKKKVLGSLLWLVLVLTGGSLMAQKSFPIDSLPDLRVRTWTVKRTDSFEQVIRVYERTADMAAKGRPAAVFFFGGGWNGRNIEQFHEQSVHLARKGMVTIIADYRVKSINGTTPLQ